MPDRFFTVRDVAEMLQVNESTVYRLANRKGGIKAYKVGRCIRFKPSAVEEYLKEQEIKPPERAAQPFPGMRRFKYTPGMKVV